MPRSSDGNRLSVYDGDQITPKSAWDHYTAVMKLESIGVVAVTVDECCRRGLHAHPDPTDFDEHAVISFGGLSRKQIQSAAKFLRSLAQERGWLYQSEDEM